MKHSLEGLNVAILCANGFEESELLKPKHALEDAGAKVCVVSPEVGPLQGMFHDQPASLVQVGKDLNDANAQEFDALLIPGGVQNPDTLRGSALALDFVRAFFQAGKPVAAICHGPQVLISADLVKGRRMTAVAVVQKDLENAGAIVLDEPVVVDQGLVTSRTPDDLPEFCAAIVEEFGEGFHAGQVRKVKESVSA